jgi:hypothetical protein
MISPTWSNVAIFQYFYISIFLYFNLPCSFPSRHPDEAAHLAHRIQVQWEKEKKASGAHAPLLWKATLRAYFWEYFWSFFWALVESIVKVAEAVFLGLLVSFFQDPTSQNPINGWLYALGLTLLVSAHGILHHILFFTSMRVGMRIRVGFVAFLYKKALRLPASAFPPGELVNLVSNDVQTFESGAPFLYFAGMVERKGKERE